MNWEPIKQVLMVLVSAGGGWLAAKGIGTAETWAQIGAALVALLGAIFAAWRGTSHNLIQTTNALPEVKAVVVDRATADAIPSPTVVTPAEVKNVIPGA